MCSTEDLACLLPLTQPLAGGGFALSEATSSALPAGLTVDRSCQAAACDLPTFHPVSTPTEETSAQKRFPGWRKAARK